MKKVLFSALAAMALVACVQEAVVETPQGEAIAFKNAFVDNATRAEATTTDNLRSFMVWGFINNPSGVVFNETPVYATTSNSGTVSSWDYTGVKYWVPGQDYYFAAVAPINTTWSLNTESANTYGPGVLTFTNDANTDLVYSAAHVVSQLENAPVAFTFHHLLSKVKFSFDINMYENYLSAKVRDVKMVAPKVGTINLAVENWWDNNDWNVVGTETIDLAFGTSDAPVELFTIPNTSAYDYAISFVVDIYQNGTTDPIYTVNKTATVSTALAMGHAYNFAANINPQTLSFDTIEFTVTDVEDWTSNQNPETNVGVGTLTTPTPSN